VRFSHPWWLAGSLLAVLVGLTLIVGGWLLVRAVRRFGDEERIAALVTDRPAGRRALKGVLLVIAVAAGFVALAQPQYGRGTRVLPATNLDVIIVLDYSKSMYARDVTPSRTERAKNEVARLIADLPGARFGAVAFAGEPLTFPLTSDGGAIAQFFRQLTPSDMPVGGTAIARALEQGLDFLRRDPVSARHKKVMVLVTDGEDLEGDPESVAESAAKDHVTIHVVQIGGRTPEPIPDIDERGNTVGWRKDDSGQPLTTSLSAAGEEQLTKIARATGGNVVRSERGATGINEIAASMRKMMTEELSERVETVYADVYLYPTALALLLLLVEAFVPEARRRKPFPKAPPAAGPKRHSAKARAAALASLLALFLSGCDDGLFVRHSPAVDDAIRSLDAGDSTSAADVLQKYLSTGECTGDKFSTPESVRTYTNASLDLGLALFRVAERFGARFGDDPKAAAALGAGNLGNPGAPLPGAPGPGNPATQTPPGPGDPGARRSEGIDCALRVVRIVAADASASIELKAKAEYLTGNLEFLRASYKDAVSAYDAALKLLPARKEDGEQSVGARAAWNRAIALRRIEEEEKKPDAGKPPQQDGGPPQRQDGGKKDDDKKDDDKKDDDKKDDDKKNDDKKDDDKKDDDKKDDDKKNQPDQNKDDKKEPEKQDQKKPSPSLSQDERMLDNLEQAPTVQQEDAKRRANRVRVIGMEDK
jgi:Ca-activated chloride channel family protein